MSIQSDTAMCPICHSPSPRPWYPCTDCYRKTLRNTGRTCTVCALDLAGADNPCPLCRGRHHFLDGLVAVSSWSGPMREWLSSIKYGADSRMFRWPADLLYKAWKHHYAGLPLVPVPPRPGKIRREGRDQVNELAKHLKKRAVPVYRILKRTSGQAQKTLSRSERLAGTSLKFELKRTRSLPVCSVVVLDDIATTGATLEKCAELLKQNGSSGVFGLVLCRD